MSGLRESSVTDRVMEALVKLGKTILFRNNVGKLPDKFGRWIEYGLCKGASDRIGWTRYKIQNDDVGKQVAVFTAIELKREKGGKRSEDQERFVAKVQKDGGIADFVNDPEKAVELITTWRPQ